ncbi:hypothetical protein HFO56_02505 [Rhizobium laguerreae]|uniref:hypothetical protein n=1 Tax=Rhizobium laguerreae TaxID=1076926 RepID=UPI001C90EE14|nr:hypothetical protein [Rhizobium laguerreae]MBY3151256.1 hypothetical protein [Rhizobium laguerreae]
MAVAAEFAKRKLQRHAGLMVGTWCGAVAAIGLGGVVYDALLTGPEQVGGTLLVDGRESKELDVMERRSEKWKVAITSMQRAMAGGAIEAGETGDPRSRAARMETVFEASALEMGEQGEQYDGLHVEAVGSGATQELERRIASLNEARASLGRASLFLTQIRTGLLTNDIDMERGGRQGLALVVARWVKDNPAVERHPVYGTAAWTETVGQYMEDARAALASEARGTSGSRAGPKGFDRLLP